MMRVQILSLMLVCSTIATLPSSFDIRFQPNAAIYANFDPVSSTICSAYDWALTLAQTLSNAASIAMKSKIVLSAQHIAECITNLDDICKEVELDDIAAGLKLIAEKGVTELDCYPNNLFEMPAQFCKRTCSDGTPFVRTFKAIVNE